MAKKDAEQTAAPVSEKVVSETTEAVATDSTVTANEPLEDISKEEGLKPETEEMEIEDAVLEDAAEEDDEDTEDDILAEAEALLAKIFEKRRVHSTTRTQKRKIYSNSGIVKNATEKSAKTPAEERHEEYQMFLNAATSIPKTVLTGEIIGSMIEPSFKTIVVLVKANGTKGHFTVKIPLSMLLPIELGKYQTPEENSRLDRMLNDRLGSTVRFCIYDVFEKEGFAYASRLDAMDADCRRYYIRKQSDGLPEIFDGKIVSANIVETRRDSIVVDANGVECTIKGKDLGWTRRREVNEEFEVGGTVLVKITDIMPYKHVANNKTFNLVTAKASIRAAQPDPSVEHYNDYEIGTKLVAVCKQCDESGLFVTLPNGMDCICFKPNFCTPIRGQKLLIRIRDKDDNKRQLAGTVIKVFNSNLLS